MIGIETFLITLFLTSTLTSLTAEAVKKILVEHNVSYRSNTVVGIISLVLSVLIGVGYTIVSKTGCTPEVIVYIIGHAYISWLCAMVGYDKVIKSIKQVESTKQE